MRVNIFNFQKNNFMFSGVEDMNVNLKLWHL